MTDTDLTAPFDDELIRAVASENDVDPERLSETLEAHQRTMHENPGVEDLVYEWRKRFEDPVLHRSQNVYVVAVRPSVWEEFGTYLDVDGDVLGALVAVHQEYVVRSVPEAVLESVEDRVPVVVVRGAGD